MKWAHSRHSGTHRGSSRRGNAKNNIKQERLETKLSRNGIYFLRRPLKNEMKKRRRQEKKTTTKHEVMNVWLGARVFAQRTTTRTCIVNILKIKACFYFLSCISNANAHTFLANVKLINVIMHEKWFVACIKRK